MMASCYFYVTMKTQTMTEVKQKWGSRFLPQEILVNVYLKNEFLCISNTLYMLNCLKVTTVKKDIGVSYYGNGNKRK